MVFGIQWSYMKICTKSFTFHCEKQHIKQNVIVYSMFKNRRQTDKNSRRNVAESQSKQTMDIQYYLIIHEKKNITEI